MLDKVNTDTDVPLSKEIQVELLALLSYDRKGGAQVAAIVSDDTFDGVHRSVARGIYQYRREYGRPPFTDVGQIITQLTLNTEQRKTAELIHAKMRRARKGMNKDFTIESATRFKLRQQLKTGLTTATEKLIALISTGKGSEIEIMAEMAKAARQPQQQQALGINLGNLEQALGYLNKDLSGYILEIKPIDEHGVRLRPGTLTVYMGAKNSGKSWFCTHVTRKCTGQGANVLHVSLEMSETEVAKRYHQAFFGVAQRKARYEISKLEFDDFKKLIGWTTKTRKTTARIIDGQPANEFDIDSSGMTLDNPKYKKWIERQYKKYLDRMDRIRVVAFPTSTLTLEQLDSYVSYLENAEGWQPHVIAIDYPDLMKLSTKDYRLDLGMIYKELRGFGIQRNAAIIAPTQVNREGMESKKVSGVHVAEAVDKLFTADNVFAYSQTDTEAAANLARLQLLYSRDCEAGLDVVIAQNYTLGQYVIDAHRLSSKYAAKVFERKGKVAEEPAGFDMGKKRR